MTIELPEHERWRLGAACTGLSQDNYDLFYPEGRGPQMKQGYEHAKALCVGCPVIDECLSYAIENGIAHGVWGGTAPRERGFRPDRKIGLTKSEMWSGLGKPSPREEWVQPQPEFDLWDLTFTKEELEATVAARRRRTEILARLDAELGPDPLEESAA